jgi:hypothetical protein
MTESELLVILCTAAISASFYAGCCKIAGVIGSFTINFVKVDEQDETVPEKKQ